MWRSAVGEHARSVREALKLRDTFTLNQGFKGYSLRRHLGVPFLSGTSHDATTRTPTDIIRQEIRKMIRQRRRALTPEQHRKWVNKPLPG